MRDFIVRILVKINCYKKAVDLFNKLRFKVMSRRMKKCGLRMLTEAQSASRESGTRLMLFFGTLLGAIREHGFIPYDPDVDLAVLDSEVTDEFFSCMATHGFKLEKQFYFKDTGQVIEDNFSFGKLSLDVFRLFPDKDKYYCICARRHESKDWKDANMTEGFPCVSYHIPQCDIVESDFLGVKVFVPEKADEWMRCIYSDSYMTPIKDYDPEKIVTTKQSQSRRLFRRYF